MKNKIIPLVLMAFFLNGSMRAQDNIPSQRTSLHTLPALVKGKSTQIVFGKIPALETYYAIEGNVEVDFGGQAYFYNNGNYFIYNGARYLLVTPPIGLKIKDLPVDKERFGDADYYSKGIFYRKIGSDYEVIKHPQGAIIYKLPALTAVATIGEEAYYEYLGVLYKKVFVKNEQAFEVVGELTR